MSNQDERLGSLLILSDLALILSTYGVLFAFNYLIEPINANTWIVCTFFVGIKILIVGISDITGIGRYYIVSLLFVLIADVIIFLINQLMAFSLSLRLILLMTIVDMVMVIIAIFIWKRFTKQNFRPIEPEGISWDDEVFDENEAVQPVLETGPVDESNDVFHFDSIEPDVMETVSDNIVEDLGTQETETNESFMNFNELTEELPTQEEIEKQLAFDNELETTESSLFEVETPPTSVSDEEAFSNISLFSEEQTTSTSEKTFDTEENILFTTDEGPLYADDKLSKFVDEDFFTSAEETEPEASEIESLAEADTVIDELPVEEPEPLEVDVEEETDEFEPTLEEPEEPVMTTEAEETVETPIFTADTESEETEVEPEQIVTPEPEVVEATTESAETVPIEEEFNIFNYTSDQIFNQEQSEAEVLEEADTVEEQKTTTSSIDDLFNIPLFHGSSEPASEEEPIMTTNEETVEENDRFFVDNIYDYNDITGSTIGFNKRFAPIPFNVTQDQLYSLTNDVKSEMIRFNENLSKLIDAYNESLPSSKSNEKINDLISLTNQDSINDADRIIRNKIDLLNQREFVSEGLIHNFVEIINKLNNRVYSIEIAQENLNEKLKLEQERLAEQERQQRLWEETHRTPSKPASSISNAKEYTSEDEPMLNESEVLLRNDDMDIIIDSADLELLKEFMAQQEKK